MFGFSPDGKKKKEEEEEEKEAMNRYSQEVVYRVL
jgi:hypothetical protein